MTDFPFRYRVTLKDGTEGPWHVGYLVYTIHGNEVRHRLEMPDLPDRLGDGDRIDVEGAVPAQHPFRASN